MSWETDAMSSDSCVCVTASAMTIPSEELLHNETPLYCLKQDGEKSVWVVKTDCETESATQLSEEEHDKESHPEGGQLLTLKRWPCSWGVLLRTWLGIAQHQRQQRGSVRFRRCSIPTPRILSCRKSHYHSRDYFELRLEHIPGEDALNLLVEHRMTLQQGLQLSQALGNYVATLIASGFTDRDFKLNNIVIPHAREFRDPIVIDTVGVKRTLSKVHGAARMIERVAIMPLWLGIPIQSAWMRVFLREALKHFTAKERSRVLSKVRRMSTKVLLTKSHRDRKA